MSNARYGFRTFTTGEVRTLARKGVLQFVETGFFSDLFGMPDVAISMRKLRSAATNCIRVRRSSDNAEQDFGFTGGSANSPLDTAAVVSFVGAGNDGFITTFYDQSTNGNDGLQSTSTNQPLIVQNGTLVDSASLPALFFTTSSPFYWLDIANVNGKTTITAFRVTDTSDTKYCVLNCGQGNARHGFIADSGNNNTFLTNLYGASPLLFANGSSFTGTTRNDVYNFLNGRKIVVERGDTSNWGGTFRFGGMPDGFDYSGKMQELIIYFSDKTADRTAIETNIDDYYNVL
jgi:hypothetical protein